MTKRAESVLTGAAPSRNKVMQELSIVGMGAKDGQHVVLRENRGVVSTPEAGNCEEILVHRNDLETFL